MFFIRLLLILSASFLLQFTLVENISLFYGNLNLLFIVVVFYALYYSGPIGFLTALLLGVLHDSICTTTFGLFLFGYMLTFVLIYLTRDKFQAHNVFSQLIVVLITFLVFKLVTSWAIFVKQAEIGKEILFFNFLSQLGYLLLFSPMVIFVLSKVSRNKLYLNR